MGRKSNLLTKQKFGGSVWDDASPSRPCSFPQFAPSVSAFGCKEVRDVPRSSPSPIHFLIRTWCTSCDFLTCWSPRQILFIPLWPGIIHSTNIDWTEQLPSARCWAGHFIRCQGSVTAGLRQANPRSQWGPGLRCVNHPPRFPVWVGSPTDTAGHACRVWVWYIWVDC